jgi:hypothetical protein
MRERAGFSPVAFNYNYVFHTQGSAPIQLKATGENPDGEMRAPPA